MSSKKIVELPSASAVATSVVPTSDGSTTNKVTLGDIAKLGTELSGSLNIYVDGNRTDSYTADGTIIRPFKTIQDAVDYAETLDRYAMEPIAPSEIVGKKTIKGVVINILSYAYYGDVVLSRPGVHLRGTIGEPNSYLFCKMGKLTINSTYDAIDPFSNQYTISNIVLTNGNNTGDCLTIAGDVDCRVALASCMLNANNPSPYRCLNITHTGNPKIFCNNVNFNNPNANTTSIESTSNGWLDIQNSTIYSGDANAIVFSGATLTVNNVTIQAAGSEIINASGSGTLSIGNSTLSSSKANATGIALQNTVVCNAVQNVFNIPSGTGYAVNGVLGTVFVHAFNAFAPGSNNKIKNTVAAVPFTTSLVSAG